MPFDVQAARAAGYTDAEIADYLGKKSGFDVNSARKSGYQDGEIVSHLEAKQTAKAREDSWVGKVGDAIVDAAPTAIRMMPAFAGVADVFSGVRQRAQSGQAQVDAAKDEGFLDRAGSLLDAGTAQIASGAARTIQGLTGSARARQEAETFDRTSNGKIEGQTTWQDVKDADGFLATAAKLPGFALDSGIESMPGMAVAALPYVGVGLYGASNTGNIAQQRAQSDDRDSPTFGDVLIAAPAGIASAYLERAGEFMAAKMPGKTLLTSTAKAAGAEAGTEFLQSGVEYAGGSIGTKKGFDAGEALDQSISGAIAGAGMGGAIHLAVKGGQKVITLGDQYGPRALAIGERTKAALNARILTPEDEASPIPNDLIQQGKVEVADAAGKSAADSILTQAGMPTTGKRVSVTMPDGRVQSGTVFDAFLTDAGDLGTAHGIAIKLDNGDTFTEHFDALREAGVKIQPISTDGADFTAEADAIDAAMQQQGIVPEAPDPNLTGLNVHTRSPEDRGVTGTGKGLNAAVLDGLRKRGLSEHVARGVAAGIQAESRSDPNVRGGYEGRALGIGQWLGDRRAEIIRRYGDHPTLDQQLDFLVDELNGRDAGGKHVLAAQNDADALNAYITKFMRPAKGKETTSDLERGAAALGVGVDSVGGAAEDSGSLEAIDPNTRNEASTGKSYLDQARSFGQVVGDPIDNEWSRFSDTSGTLNVPRDQMPQIKAEHRGAMVNFLNARGIAHEEQDVPASSLKPTQAEFSNFKVKQATEYTGGDRAILTSSDGYVLDGHHQWMAALAKGENVRTIKLDAPIAELLKTVPEFPSATDANGSTDTKPVEIPQGPRGTTLGQPVRFTSKGGNGTVTFKYLDDGRLERTITYDDGETVRSHLMETSSGETWESVDGGPQNSEPVFFESEQHARDAARHEIPGELSTTQNPQETAAQQGNVPAQSTTPDRQDVLAVVDANNQTKNQKHSAAERASFRLGAASELGIDPKFSGNADAVTQDWPDAFERGKKAARAELTKRRIRERSKGKPEQQIVDDKAERETTALDYDSSERHERVNMMQAAGVNSVMLAGGPKRNSATPFDDLPPVVQNLLHTYRVKGKHEHALRQAMAETSRPDEHPGLIVKSLQTGKETLIQPKGTVQPGQSTAKGLVTIDDETFKRVWNDPKFKAAMKEIGTSPHRESPAAHELVQGWYDGGAFEIEKLRDHVADLEANAKAQDMKPFGFNPEQSYVEGFYARVTGEAVEVRQIQSGDKLGAAEALKKIEDYEDTPPSNSPTVDKIRADWEEKGLVKPKPAGRDAAVQGVLGGREVDAGSRNARYGESNKLFTADAAAKARALLQSKRNQLNSGFDPEIAQAGLTLMGYHIEAGARSFIHAAQAIATDLGVTPADLRGHLRGWYANVRMFFEDNGHSTDGMDDDATVKVDLARIDQWGTTAPETAMEGAENVDARNAVRPQGTGSLETVANGDVPGNAAERDAGRGSAASQPGGRESGGNADGERDAAPRSGGDGSPRPDNTRTGTGSRLTSKPQQVIEDKTPAQEAAVAPSEGIEHASAPNVPGIDFTITDEVSLGQGGEATKYADNVAAIRTLKQIEAENRRASPAEQRTLARYVGWGGLKNAFRVAGAKSGEGIAKGWEDRVAEIEDLLTPAELKAARNSTTAAYYTSQTIVDAMWRAAQRLGFMGGAVLEPSVGTGNFIGLMPDALRGPSQVFAVEYDSLTARIAQTLYPNATIVHSGLQDIPLPQNQFALAIGNPPFGRESLFFPYNTAIKGKSIHNQFFIASLDSVAPGGLMAMVVSHNLMDALDNSSRLMMAERAQFIGGIRLPDTAFKENARTEVVTDMLFFRKRSDADVEAAQAAIEVMRGAKMPERLPPGYDGAKRDIEAWTKSSKILDPAGSGEEINVNDYFLTNDHMVVGKINATGTMNNRAELNVTLDDPSKFKPMLDAALERLPRLAPIDDLAARTTKHFTVMADAMRLAASRAEVGSVRIDLDGNLKTVIDFDSGEQGKALMREITLSENTPFSDDYTYTVDGKWQKTGDMIGPDGKPVKVEANGKKTNRNEKKTVTYERESDIPVRDRWGAERIEMLRAMLPIRDAMKKQLILETQGATDGMIELNRKSLNKAYDAFTKKHGKLHGAKAAKIAMMMPDGALALAAENNVGTKDSAHFIKSDIMERRVAMPPQLAEKAEDASEAIAITLAESGKIDLERVASLLGTDVVGAERALSEGENPRAFFDPELNRWEPADLYLSGMVRKKLHAAQASDLPANIKALEAVMPADWTADQITPVIGSGWIPGSVYADFLRSLGYSDAAVTYSPITNSFSVMFDGKASAQWETSPNVPAIGTIVGKALNSQSQKVTYLTEDKKTVVDEVATAEAEQKASEIHNEFLDWAFADEARREHLIHIFNEKYNTRLIRQRDGSHLKLYGKVPDTIIKMRRHQMNAIWRGITDPAVLYDHVVGAGKTFTAIARVMERRRMGLSKKPMVVVPNHLVEQWANDAKLLYPGSNVIAAGKGDFERKNRRRLFARIASSDFDMVIIGHSSFGFIDLDRGTEERYLTEELEAARAGVEAAAEEAAATGLGGGRKPFTVAEAERLVKKLEERLARLRGGKRDRLLTFEEMGVDDLTIDEAHEFKNLAYSSRLSNVSGMGNKTGSQKAMDLHLKVRLLRERQGTSVAFLTGTPISNSVAEMYLLLRNLAPQEMREMGIDNFDAWRSMFVSYASAWEPTEAGGVKEVSRLGREWNNMRSLMDLYYSVADAVTMEDIKAAFEEDNPGKKFPLPDVASKLENGSDRESVYVKPVPEQRKILADIVAGFEGLPGISDVKERNAERLRLMDKARKVSLDARAVDPFITVENEGGKIPAVVDRIAQIYSKWSDDKGTQIVFLDRSVPKAKGDEKIVEAYDALRDKLNQAIAMGDEKEEGKILDALEKYDPNEIDALRVAITGGWNAYDEIKRQLVAKGIPESEIRFVQEANTDQQKKNLFGLVKSGAVRVLIGSTPRMGAGTNLQDRLVALHHVDVTWKPSDIEQREGRIVRQGNKLLEKYGNNFKVDVIAYATEMTVDAKMWSLNADKLKAINGIRKYDGSFTMEFEDEESASMAEMAALATGNPLMVERVMLDGDVKKLELQQRSYNNRINALRDKISSNNRRITSGPGKVAMYRDFADDIEAKVAAAKTDAAKRSVTVEGVSYTTREAAMDAAIAAIAKVRGDDAKARFSIEVGGEKVTTQDLVSDTIRKVLGTPGFVGRIDGRAIASTFDLAKAISEKSLEVGKSKSEFTIDGIEINGVPVEIDVMDARYRKGKKEITLSVIDGKGRSVASYGSTADGMSPGAGRALIEKAVEGLDPERFRYSATIEDRYVERARDELPELEVEVGKPWPKLDELEEKRARLADVIKMLAETKNADRIAEGNTLNEERAAFLAEANDEAYATPDGNEATRDAGTSDPLRGLGEPGAVSVRGLAIATEIKRTGSAALVGHSVANTRELASLAQVYRDPRYETFRVFFTKGNEIVHATGVTSRMAGETPLLPGGNDKHGEFERWLKQHMERAGADGYYLLHNHPSGEPKPSEDDIGVTQRVAKAVPGFKGHVVINSNRFSVIGEVGNYDMHDLWAGDDKLLVQSTPHPILGQKVGGTSALAQVAKSVQQPDYLTIVATDPRFNIRAIIDFPRAHLEKSDLRLLAAARKLTRATGTTHIMLVGTREDIQHPTVVKGFKKGFIFEGTDGDYHLQAHFPRDPGVNPERRTSFSKTSPGRFVAEDREPFQPGPVSFDDTETERRFQDAKAGLDSPQSFRARAGEWMETAWHGMTRHWASLPNVPKYADLQQKLRAIESAPQHARERTIAMLEEMVKDFSKEDLDLFTRKVILDDLSWDAANDRDLPFGFTPETLLIEKQKVDAAVQADPEKKVWRAAMKRKLANRKVAQELVDAGVLEAEQIKNPAYYRHQVLEYARAQAQYARTPGKKLRQPKWAKRMGSSLDINANLLEAEFDWLNKAFIDIPVAKTIEWIKKSEHNILDDLRSEAKAGNKAGIDAAIVAAKEVLEDKQATQDEQMKAALLIDQERGFRQHISMGFDHVRTALENGDIDVPRQFQKAADAIQNSTSDASDPPFAFLAWMLDNDQPGAMGAAMIMKAIGQRRTWTKALLGKAYVDPQNADELVKRLAPDGYRTWQPDEGKLLFTVKTIPEHVIDAMITKLDAPEGVDPGAFRAALEGARSALAMGGDRYTMILPEEVADTLSNLRRDEMDGMFEHVVRNPVRWWKRWVLINPRRIFKYNLNNLSGDLDAVLAGNPHLLRRVKEAATELANVRLGKAKASERYNDAVARGVFDSGLSIQEIPDINQLAAFERFANEPTKINKLTMIPMRKAWNALQGATQWRENIFRYAAYLDYADRIEAGESQASIGYGGSVPKMVDAVTDPKDRAALLARDLLGDYGAISHWGSWLRGTVLPFWSWSEINTKRYWRLTSNAYSEGLGKGIATGTSLAVAAGARRTAWMALRMAMLYGLMTLWNNLFFPDEEDKLDDQQKAQLHIILGTNANGEIITLRTQGALSDALGWFGLEDMGKAAKAYELGRGPLSDVLTAMPKAVVNKIGGGVSPIIKTPVEAMTGKKLWPDVFNTQVNRDPWRNTLQSVSLENEYDAILGKPSRGYARSWQEAFVYRKDPGEMAYNQARGIAYDWLKRVKGQEFAGGFTSPRGEAQRDYRTALKYGDRDAATKAYEEMAKLGVDQGDYAAMMKRAAPLGPIAKKDRAAFIAQLTPDEYATMQRAQAYYETTFLGR